MAYKGQRRVLTMSNANRTVFCALPFFNFFVGSDHNDQRLARSTRNPLSDRNPERKEKPYQVMREQ